MEKVKRSFLFTLTLPLFGAGGGKRIRTADHLVANQALSQLSYTPKNQLRVSGFGLRTTRNPELETVFWWA